MDSRTPWNWFALGIACGLRSMTGPAVVRWRAGDAARLVFAAFAAGELVADKLPAAPPRTMPPALAFRALSGAFTARSAARATGADGNVAAIMGALGAVFGSYVGMALRLSIVRTLRLPDPLVAAAEDILAVGVAIAASRPGPRA